MVWVCNTCIEAALAEGDGLVLRREHRNLGKAIDRAVRRGTLRKLASDVYADAGRSGELPLRVRAVMAAEPTAVITGRAAAALTWWAGLAVPVVTAAHPRRPKSPLPGLRWQRTRVPEELVVETDELRLAAPALSVLDLIPELGGAAIDEALRGRAVTLPQLEAALALTPGRPGNVERARLLVDSRDEPWSEAERTLHGAFRELRLPCPFRTNYPVPMADGTTHPVDIALPELLLGFEVDGFAFHHSRRAFDRDHLVGLDMARSGWQLVRITANQTTDTPDLTAILQVIVDQRAALFGFACP